jgi:hypothetical protein
MHADAVRQAQLHSASRLPAAAQGPATALSARKARARAARIIAGCRSFAAFTIRAWRAPAR